VKGLDSTSLCGTVFAKRQNLIKARVNRQNIMAAERFIRVFVIGGLTHEPGEDPAKMREACRMLGERLGAEPGYQIVVCSAHESSADANVLYGFAKTSGNQPGRVIIHRPLDVRSKLRKGESMHDQWDRLVGATGLAAPTFRENSEARVSSQGAFANAFLLCQIRALKEDTDVIVAVGGRGDGSAVQLLAIARDSYPIVPFSFLGGAGKQEYLRQGAALRGVLGDQRLADALESPSGIERVRELIDRVRRLHGHHCVFLSYPWKRAQDADYVEVLLRRYPRITLFRDEEDIRSGEPISERIRNQLDACDVFLALWCAEYAASPHCYYEWQIAGNRPGCRVHILRLDETRPVWPALRKPRSHEWKNKWAVATTRESVAACLRELVESLEVRFPDKG